MSSLVTYFLAESYSGEIYDEQMLDSVDSVIGRLRIKNGEVDVDLPPAVVSLLLHNFRDDFFFQIISPNGQLIDGDADLPMPVSTMGLREPKFGYSIARGEMVRTLLVLAHVEDAPDKTVFVQVAETMESRKQLARRIFVGTAISQLLIIVLGAAAINLGVDVGLRKLELLRKQLASRPQHDLSHIEVAGTPQELGPLLGALNNLFDVVREDQESRQRFVSNAAHQMKTPLAGLKTYIGVLKNLVNDTASQNVINQIDAGIDRTDHLVKRLLSLAKAEPRALLAIKHELLDLNELLPEILVDFAPEALSKQIELAFEGSERPALIMGDRDGLKEMICNLVENALRYSPESGHVTVSVVCGDSVKLLVEDGGPGIPESERSKVFERFYRVLGTGVSGSGLGLSIVSEVARSHNARVQVDSGPQGRGSLFTVEFAAASSLDGEKLSGSQSVS